MRFCRHLLGSIASHRITSRSRVCLLACPLLLSLCGHPAFLLACPFCGNGGDVLIFSIQNTKNVGETSPMLVVVSLPGTLVDLTHEEQMLFDVRSVTCEVHTKSVKRGHARCKNGGGRYMYPLQDTRQNRGVRLLDHFVHASLSSRVFSLAVAQTFFVLFFVVWFY